MAPLLRRDVVKSGLLTIAAGVGSPAGDVSAAGPFLVRDGAAHGGPVLTIAAQPFAAAKISGSDVAGRFAVIEIHTPPGRGPELHVHMEQNEWFCVQHGRIGLQCGTEQVVLRAGDSYMAPRGVAHAFVSLGSEVAQLLNLFDPAGQMEAFFPEYAAVLSQPGRPDPARMTALYAKFGLRVVGPPLSASAFNA